MAERNDFEALGLDLLAGSGIHLQDTENGLIISVVGGPTPGGGGALGHYEGQFDATTVRQRAFDANDYIVYDTGENQIVVLAPVEIPINSPAPNQPGSLWGQLYTTITSGISVTDLTNRLRNYVLQTVFTEALQLKADLSELSNYVRTSTYNIEKARLESGITGNDNDIAALMTALNNLQNRVNNLGTGTGGGGGDVTTDALNSAINNLRSALQASIDTLTTQVGNIPITSDVLWATSKPFVANFPAGEFDTDWTLGEDASTGVAVSGDFVHIPRQFRGELHVDMVASDDSFLQRLIVPLSVGTYDGFSSPFPEHLQVRIDVHPSDATLLRLYLRVRGGTARTISAAGVGGRAKLYGVSALPRAQVVGITQAQLDKAIDGINDFYIDITPRYARFRTSGSDPDDLDGNFVFVFSHVPEEYALANVVEVNFQGIQAYRGAWTPSTSYITFGFEPTSLNNLRNNTGRNQTTWQIEITFFQGTTNLGSERSFVVIDRG